jgi:hypothetical protein
MWLLFLEQLVLGTEWGPLSVWQQHRLYKAASGSLLAGFLCFQWLLALLRVNSPVLLFLHSTRLGFGYLLVLSTVYVANNVVGLVSPSAFPRLKILLPFWVISHIALSVLLVAMVVYHVGTVLYFE